MIELDAVAGRGWGRARNLVCVRLDTIGDVLMTTPAMRALKHASPDRRVTLLTSTAGAAVAPFLPEVDDVVVYDPPWMKGTERPRPRTDLEMIGELRARNFDAAIIFTVFSQNPLPAAMLCYLAEIPLRLAYSREKAYHLLTDRIADPDAGDQTRHEVRRHLDLVAEVGFQTHDERLSFEIRDAARQRVDRWLDGERIDPGRLVVMHPGSSAPSRRYPAASFGSVAAALTARGYEVVLTGSAPERPIVQEVQSSSGVVIRSRCGKWGLGELAALIERAAVLVSNNTAPVHIAAAVGTPVVDLYALTNPQHTPWQVPSRVLYHDVPCRFCYSSVCPEGHHHCLTKVRPDDVVEAAVELASQDRRPAPSAALGSFIRP